jgi:hypothetical protein
VAPQFYVDIWINTSRRCPGELHLPHHLLRRILAARIEHDDFADFISGSVMKTHIYVAVAERGSLQFTAFSAE